MKVIVLDVDGELTYSGYSNRETHNIDIEKVKLLKQIVDNTGAKILLSSSWKQGYNKETSYKTNFYKVLENMLAKCDLYIYDITDDIPENIQNTNRKTMDFSDLTTLEIEHGTGRGAEVDKWINEHDVESYVILDDEDWDWKDYGMADNWIQPSWHDEDGGLHIEHIEKAIKILNKGEK